VTRLSVGDVKPAGLLSVAKADQRPATSAEIGAARLSYVQTSTPLKVRYDMIAPLHFYEAKIDHACDRYHQLGRAPVLLQLFLVSLTDRPTPSSVLTFALDKQ
jgi:hypothetical protein